MHNLAGKLPSIYGTDSYQRLPVLLLVSLYVFQLQLFLL